MNYFANRRFGGIRLSVIALVAAGMLAVGFTTSCDQNFNAPDPNSPTPETASIQSLITGLLANSRYTEINEFLGAAGRETYTSAADDPRIFNQPAQDAISASDFTTARPWANMYFTIGNARSVIAAAQKLPAADRAGVEGVAKTIWAHELIRLSGVWYDAGIKIDYKFDPSAPFVARAQSLAEAAKLLDEANTALASAGSAFVFRLGPGFAGYDTPAQYAKVNRAIRARCAAYQGDYTACLTALQGSFLKEATTTWADLYIGVNHVYSTQPGDITPGARSGGGGSPYNQNIAAPSIRWWAHKDHVSDNPDAAVDLRILNKVAKPTVVAVPSSITGAPGLSASWAINMYPDLNTPTTIIRNEELLLLRAEARALGTSKDLTGATADINRVRAAAGAPPIAALTDATALTRILYERRYSLFFEGYRWIDLKRFNRLTDIKAERAVDKVMQAGWPKPLTEIPQ